MKTYYHIRKPNGTTLDWQDGARHTAIADGAEMKAEVYEVRGSVATLIYKPADFAAFQK